MARPRQLKIGFVLVGELNTLSGGYLYDRMLLTHLRQAGDSIRVWTLRAAPYGRLLLDNASRALRDGLAGMDCDVMIQDELAHPALICANRAVRTRGGPPVVSLVHHLTSDEDRPRPFRIASRALERSYLRTVDGILTNTRETLARVETVAGRSVPSAIAYPASAQPGPAPSPNEIAARLDAPRDALRVLFVGNLIERKRLDVLIDAAGRLHAEGIPLNLTVVGGESAEPDTAAGYRRRARFLEDANWIRFLGPRRGHTLRELYSSSDVLCVPSSYEGFGMVYLEGMAHGLPALGAASGGAREIIQDDENGWLIETGDVLALTAHLRTLATDRAQLRRMSLAARARYDAHPTWNDSMGLARDFLLQMAGR